MSTVAPTFDTVGIAAPIDSFNPVGMTHTINAYGTLAESHRWSRKLEGGGFLSTGIGNAVWIEASLPKRVDPEGGNITPLDLEGTVKALGDLYLEATEHVAIAPGHHFEESKVIRLDMVRDFTDVHDLSIILNGLARVDQPGRSKVRRFADPARGQAETLRVGPKAWGATLYDKHQETANEPTRAPEGSLRFEARLHQPQLRSKFATEHGGNVLVVEDLYDRERQLGGLQRAWFERAGFDRQIAPRDTIGEAIRHLEVSPNIKGSLWAYLTLPGYGNDLHRHTLRKYRSLAADIGVAPYWFHDDDTVNENVVSLVAQVVGLDYDSGTSVAA